MNYTLAIDEKASGDARYAVFLSHSTLFIQQNRECQTLFLSVGLYSSPLFADIHGQDDEALVAILLISLLQSGPLATAVGSPGGPEIEEHRLALQVAQRDLVAVEIGQL